MELGEAGGLGWSWVEVGAWFSNTHSFLFCIFLLSVVLCVHFRLSVMASIYYHTWIDNQHC